MTPRWQEYWTFRIVDQDTGASVPGVPVTVREEGGGSGHWVSDADGLVRIPKHDRPRLRLRVGLRADDMIELDARSLPDDPVPLVAPPRGDAADGPASSAATPPGAGATGTGSRDKPGHVVRYARIGVAAADADVMATPADRAGPPSETVRYGVLFEIEQYWQSQGFQAGDVLYSLSLGPGDEAKVAVLDNRWRKKQDGRDRPFQIVSKMVAAPTVGDGLDAVPLEAFVMSELQAAAAETGRFLSHRTVRAADSLRRRPIGVVELEGEKPAGSSVRTVRNMRADGVLTYHFVEAVERFRVITRTPHVRPAILVPFRLPNIATREVVRRFGHALRRALLDRALQPAIEAVLAGADDGAGARRLYAHIGSHPSYYSATIIAAGDPAERAAALARLRDPEQRPLPDVIENVVVGRVGNYVAFPLRSVDVAPASWRAVVTGPAARALRASEETPVTLPIPGVWLRVQLGAAVSEEELGMGFGGGVEAEPEAEETQKSERGLRNKGGRSR
jgi:hypothetical protein